jgi:hypothetical protein
MKPRPLTNYSRDLQAEVAQSQPPSPLSEKEWLNVMRFVD